MVRKFTAVLIFSCLVASFTGCGEDKPLKIGFVGGLSGRVADLGISARNGVMLALERKNASGGVRGRRLELIVRDDKQSVESARNAVIDLLDQEVEVIIGPTTSSMAMAVVPLMEKSSVCLLSPTATTTDLLGKDDTFLRVLSSARDYAIKSALFQYRNQGRRRAVAVYDTGNRSYTESWLKNFQSEFEELGGRILKIASFKSGHGVAFYALVKDLLDYDPDFFVVVTNAVDAALICQQVRKIDENVAIAMAEWASTERFIELGGAASDGVWVPQFINRNDTSKRYRDFVQSYKERFGQAPGFAGLMGYDAATVAIEALENQKRGEQIKDVILRLKKFQGIQQEIIIDRYGDADRQTYITRVLNGKYNTIE